MINLHQLHFCVYGSFLWTQIILQKAHIFGGLSRIRWLFLLSPLFVLVLSHELSEGANIVALMLEEIKAIHPPESELKKVIVQ